MYSENVVYHGDSLVVLKGIGDCSVDLIYTDPPFGTGSKQTMLRKGKSATGTSMSYDDPSRDYLAFLVPRVLEMHRVLKDTGTMYLHLDWRWVHYVKVECDKVFGYDNFMNEIVWSYNFGGRGKDRWPQKHDTILVYAKNLSKHKFNIDSIDRIPYAAPALQYVGRTKEEAEKRIAEGQIPTDVWSMSIVGTSSKERTGYPTQKPLKLVKRILKASSDAGDTVLDPFCGSGTLAVAAATTNRIFVVADTNLQAIETTVSRLKKEGVNYVLKEAKDEV